LTAVDTQTAEQDNKA